MATEQKLKLEVKIRDAAQSLSRVNAAHKKVSKQTEEQLDAAECRVATAQKEYWRISERTNEVHRKLLEHCAGVLGYSVQKMEKRINPLTNAPSEFTASCVTTPNRTSTTSSVPSRATSSKARFEGAHLFAGHVDAQVPRLPPSASDVATLEAKLRAATGSLNAANKQQAEMARELQRLRLEKEQLESTMNVEMQRAGETVAALEKELPRFEELQAKYNELSKEKSVWEEDRVKLTTREQEVERLERRLEVLEEKSGETTEMQRMLTDAQRKADSEMEQKEEEISALERRIVEAREQWEAEKASMEQDRLAEVGALQEELEILQTSTAARADLDEAVDALHELMRQYEVQHSPDDRSLQGSFTSLDAHLASLSEALDDHREAQGEWEVERERLESELRAQDEERETAFADRARLRRERDEAKRELAEMDSRVKVGFFFFDERASTPHVVCPGTEHALGAQWPPYGVQRRGRRCRCTAATRVGGASCSRTPCCNTQRSASSSCGFYCIQSWWSIQVRASVSIRSGCALSQGSLRCQVAPCRRRWPLLDRGICRACAGAHHRRSGPNRAVNPVCASTRDAQEECRTRTETCGRQQCCARDIPEACYCFRKPKPRVTSEAGSTVRTIFLVRRCKSEC